MLTRRLALGAALAVSSLASLGTAHAQSWKSAYPELVFAVIPAENASGVDLAALVPPLEVCANVKAHL